MWIRFFSKQSQSEYDNVQYASEHIQSLSAFLSCPDTTPNEIKRVIDVYVESHCPYEHDFMSSNDKDSTVRGYKNQSKPQFDSKLLREYFLLIYMIDMFSGGDVKRCLHPVFIRQLSVFNLKQIGRVLRNCNVLYIFDRLIIALGLLQRKKENMYNAKIKLVSSLLDSKLPDELVDHVKSYLQL